MSEIVGHGHEVVAVYSRAPAPAGRGMELKPSPVHRAAERFGIPVLHPRDPAQRRGGGDFPLPCSRCGRRRRLWNDPAAKPFSIVPELGCLNLHASLLPRWRGAAPIQRAVMAGDARDGVAVMRMEKGLDTGPVGMVERVAIGPDMTAGELHDRLAVLGADLMVRALAALSRGGLGLHAAARGGRDLRRQDHQRGGADRLVDARPRRCTTCVRGLSPFPGAFAEVDLGKGPERLKVLRSVLDGGTGRAGQVLDDALTVACGRARCGCCSVQRAGSRPMAAADFLRGVPVGAGHEARLMPRYKLVDRI